MANIESTPNERKGKPLRKKKSTRIDMTAMVDVAFLLLTFFVLTAVLEDDKIIQFIVPPPNPGPGAPVAEEKVMTFILDDGDKIRYYHGITEPSVLETGYDGLSGVRKVILDHLGRYPNICQGIDENGKKTPAGCWDPIFVIKPRYTSEYGNLIDLIDELMIADAKKYVLGKFTEEDSLLLEGAAMRLRASNLK